MSFFARINWDGVAFLAVGLLSGAASVALFVKAFDAAAALFAGG